MQFSSLVFGALMACGAIAAPAVSEGIPGYRTEPLMWEIEVAPGQVHRLNGTVQEVHAQILKINPHFKLKNAPPETSPVLEQDGGLAKRSTVNCGTWPTCSTYRIRQGVQYLHTIGGKPYQRPGPGACSRASCSYNSAIWWCSDHDNAFNLDSFHQIANSAYYITERCAPNADSVGGQNFEANAWNTIVRHDSC